MVAPEVQTVDDRNSLYMRTLALTVDGNRKAFSRLRVGLSVTYWILVILLGAMFAVGVILIFIGAHGAATTGAGEDPTDSLLAAGAGGADLLLLGLGKPVERIRQLKDDRAQLFVILSDYHVQTALALRWFRTDEPESMLQAADRIRDLTLETVQTIETYMSVGAANPALDRAALARLEQQNRRVATLVGQAIGQGPERTADEALDDLGTILRRSRRGVTT